LRRWSQKYAKNYKDQIRRPAKSTNEFVEELETGIIPIGLKALLSEEPVSVEAKHHAVDVARKLINAQERDEYEALEQAAADLVRLDRYERRAWSRQKRAIRSFMNLRLKSNLNRVEATH
jgi:hypothetical protein